jgi:hypothetical protein
LAISAAAAISAAWSSDPDFLDMRAMLRSIRFPAAWTETNLPPNA